MSRPHYPHWPPPPQAINGWGLHVAGELVRSDMRLQALEQRAAKHGSEIDDLTARLTAIEHSSTPSTPPATRVPSPPTPAPASAHGSTPITVGLKIDDQFMKLLLGLAAVAFWIVVTGKMPDLDLLKQWLGR